MSLLRIAILIAIPLDTVCSCEEGDLTLVAGSSSVPLEGRVEICRDGKWGTVCDTRWDDSDAEVVCRQLGFTTGSSMALPNDYISSVIGRGRSQISLYNVTCAGHELQLRHCNSSSVPLCDHSNDVGVRCSYAGPPIIVFNGRRYPNNSIIDLQDIGPGDHDYNASVYCLTNLTRCCSGLTEVFWHIPEGLDLSIHRNYEYYSTPTQTVNLYRPKSSYVSGVFYCSILDQFSVAVFLYIGIYQRGIIIGTPSIISLKYNKDAQMLTCTSTGGPATTVLWSKDNSLLKANGVLFKQSQFIVNTGLATYENKLDIRSRDQIYGLYRCEVRNVKGMASGELRVSVCNDGDTLAESANRDVIQICSNGTFYNVSKSHHNLLQASLSEKIVTGFPAIGGKQKLNSGSSFSVTAVLGGLVGVLSLVGIILATLVLLMARRSKQNRYLATHRNPACNNYDLQVQEENVHTGDSITTYMVQNPMTEAVQQEDLTSHIIEQKPQGYGEGQSHDVRYSRRSFSIF